MSQYLQQAKSFLEETNTKIDIVKIGCLITPWSNTDKPVNTYSVTLTNKRHTYNFKFYSSIQDTYGPYDERYDNYWGSCEHRARKKWRIEMRKKDYTYDVLACLNIDYSEDFEDFCSDFGYSDDSITAHRTYDAVRTETKNLKRLFTESELEKLSEVN